MLQRTPGIGAALALWSFAALAAPPLPDCEPSVVEGLQALKAADFRIDGDADPLEIALKLAGCLGSPDPAIRDGIAYEGLTALLRGDRLDEKTRRRLMHELVRLLQPGTPDGKGFRKPFAALALSEVARTDRIAAYLGDDERAALVETAAVYLSGISDYRGFDDTEGWRHGVAHAADLAMQLSLNGAVEKPQLERLREAIALQIPATRTHSYIFGESERLARPILFMAHRGAFTEEEWSKWLEQISGPGSMASWADAFSSEAGLARRHNVAKFLSALHATVCETENANLKRLLPGVRAALEKIP